MNGGGPRRLPLRPRRHPLTHRRLPPLLRQDGAPPPGCRRNVFHRVGCWSRSVPSCSEAPAGFFWSWGLISDHPVDTGPHWCLSFSQNRCSHRTAAHFNASCWVSGLNLGIWGLKRTKHFSMWRINEVK